jgi:hypothetical protein
VLRLLVTAHVVPSSSILVALMMEAIRYSETSVLTEATQRGFREDGIFHESFCLSMKFYENSKCKESAYSEIRLFTFRRIHPL